MYLILGGSISVSKCDRLCRDAAQRLFEALQATADKEKSERGQEASFPIGTMEHLFNVVNALVRSNYFDKKKLASCWFRCCLPVLRASAESLLSKLCTSSSDHNFTPIPETGYGQLAKIFFRCSLLRASHCALQMDVGVQASRSIQITRVCRDR